MKFQFVVNKEKIIQSIPENKNSRPTKIMNSVTNQRGCEKMISDLFYNLSATKRAKKLWAESYGLVSTTKHPKWFTFDLQCELGDVCDHVSLWKKKGSRRQMADVVIFQPYNFGTYDIQKLAAFALRHDVNIQVLDGSWHVPGATVMVAITKSEVIRPQCATWQKGFYTGTCQKVR